MEPALSQQDLELEEQQLIYQLRSLAREARQLVNDNDGHAWLFDSLPNLRDKES